MRDMIIRIVTWLVVILCAIFFTKEILFYNTITLMAGLLWSAMLVIGIHMKYGGTKGRDDP